MQHNNFATVISLVIIIGLAVIFMVAGRAVVAGLNPAAAPAATSTPQATSVVAPPGTTPSSSTGGGQTGSHSGSSSGPAGSKPAGTATPQPSATPAPSPTPATGVKVMTAQSYTRQGGLINPTTSFDTNAQIIWCQARFTVLKAGDSWRFHWVNKATGTVIWQWPSGGPSRITSDQSNLAEPASLYGPLQPGKYSCEMWVNDKLAGAAVFTIS